MDETSRPERVEACSLDDPKVRGVLARLHMVLLDGFKELYLPILELLTPRLRPGAVVLADNIFTFWATLSSYVAYVANPTNGFSSVTLFLGDGTEYSVKL